MAKIGVNLKIDVSKIDKSKIFEGKKGKYVDFTTFLDLDNPSKWGDHGFIAHSISKEERESGAKGGIVGNSTVFYAEGADFTKEGGEAKEAPKNDDFDDDVPW